MTPFRDRTSRRGQAGAGRGAQRYDTQSAVSGTADPVVPAADSDNGMACRWVGVRPGAKRCAQLERFRGGRTRAGPAVSRCAQQDSKLRPAD